jgi:hypothetical protein
MGKRVGKSKIFVKVKDRPMWAARTTSRIGHIMDLGV